MEVPFHIFTIIGTKKIVCYTKDFVIYRGLLYRGLLYTEVCYISRFHCILC